MPESRYKKLMRSIVKNSILPGFTFFLIAFFSSVVGAQGFSYTRYDLKDGLPSTTVYRITQDLDGFIWFATENGLSRFDGLHSKTLSTKDGLPDNAILAVHADKTGRVYFSPFTHTPYYLFRDSIYQLKIPHGHEANLTGISSYHHLGGRTLVVATYGPYIILPNDSVVPLSQVYKGIPVKGGIPRSTDSLAIVATPNSDTLFFLTNKGITRIETHQYSEKTLAYQNDFKSISTEKYLPVVASLSGYLANNIFFASYANTIFFFSTINGEMLYKINIEKPSSVFIDNESNLWVSTLGNGVYRFPSFSFRHISFPGTAEIFSIGNVGDYVIAGSEFSKTYQLTPADSSTAYITMDFSQYLGQSGNQTSQSTRRNRIYKLLSVDGSLYIGADAFLLRLDKSGNPLFRNIYPVKDLDIEQGTLLVCTSTEVMLLDARTLEIQDTLLRQRATTGTFYKGDYYVGTIGGLIKIDSKDKTIRGLQQLHPSFKSRIVSVKRGMDDDLWIATSGAGLIRYKDGNVTGVFKTESGITSDICTSLFIDTGSVWLGTNKGLNRIILTGPQPRVISFTTSNGLGADFINTVFAYKNMIYAGSSNGLTYFDKETTTTSSVCILHITQVTKGNEPLKKDSSYSFPYNTLNIRIDFTAISFKSAGENKYYYKLNGLDTGWNTTTNTFINYAALQPGKYVLMISAVNKFGVKSETKSIIIIITPPWWKTWWFISLALIAIAGVVLLLYRRNIRAIRKQEESKRNNDARLVALEQQALQAQMNPHFIFNCLNSIQSYILDLDVEGANKYLTAFANMIRQTLDNSSHPLISVANEIKYIDTYLQLEKMRFKDKFSYSIHVDEEIDQQSLRIPGMLLQPYIENSLRHGIQHRNDNDGMITLDILLNSQKDIICLIKDNGIGRKRSGEMKSLQHIEYQSKGTLINQKRVAAINSQFKTNIVINIDDMTDAEDTVVGTIVKISIPEFNTTIV